MIDGWLAERYRVFDQRGRGPGAKRRGPLSLTGAGLDRIALSVMEPMFLSGGGPSLKQDVRERIDEGRARYAATELFDEPSRFYRPTPAPSRFRVRRLGALKGGEHLEVRFESTYRPFEPDYAAELAGYENNAENRIRLWRHDDRARPTVICLHTWCGGWLPFTERLFDARGLYALGLNVAFVTLPFHGSRTPRQARFSGQLFPSRDIRRTNEAFAQAVADVRVLIGWLRHEQGTGPIGLLGFSLGGYTSALLAGLESDLAFVIPVIAPSSFADIMWAHGEGRPARRDAEAAGITGPDLRALFAVHCPLAYAPRVPVERLLIAWALGDVIVPQHHQTALWRHWGRPRTVAFVGGHILHFGRLHLLRSIRNWLKEIVL